jgi:hypothetical protein
MNPQNFKDITGKRFGRLVVLSLAPEYDKREGAYWICRCDCGSETKKIKGYFLRSGKTQSCGCYQKECASALNRLPCGEYSFNQLLASYKYGSKVRELSFDLSVERFGELTKQNCFYCGSEPARVFRTVNPTGDYICNGVDRLDSSKGYTYENCVPCCKTCNLMKLEMSVDEFIAACRSVVNHFDSVK